MKTIALIGGTGGLGLGLAARLAGGHRVIIGSRDASRAVEAAAKVSELSGSRVEGEENGEAARHSDVSILTLPNLSSDELLLSLKTDLAGKLVVSAIVPMELRQGVFVPTLGSGSAAERVAAVLETRVAAAFHTLSAPRLIAVKRKLDCDVLVTAETREIYGEAAEIVSSVPGLRPLYAGQLRNSRMLEELTPLLLNTGRLNRIFSPSIKIV
jgi:hypothetical protein